MLDCGFPEIYTGAYPCFSKLSVYFKLRGKRGVMPSWVSACCKDRAISWFASGVVRLNSRGVGLFYSLMCYSTGMQFLCSLHGSNETLCC